MYYLCSRTAPLSSTRERERVEKRENLEAAKGGREREREREKFEGVMVRGGYDQSITSSATRAPHTAPILPGPLPFARYTFAAARGGRGDEKLHDARLQIRPPATGRPSLPSSPSSPSSPSLPASQRRIILGEGNENRFLLARRLTRDAGRGRCLVNAQPGITNVVSPEARSIPRPRHDDRTETASNSGTGRGRYFNYRVRDPCRFSRLDLKNVFERAAPLNEIPGE